MVPAQELGDTCRQKLWWKRKRFLDLALQKSPARIRLPQAWVSEDSSGLSALGQIKVLRVTREDFQSC